VAVTPHDLRVLGNEKDPLKDEKDQLLRFDKTRFPRLKEIADQIANVPRSQDVSDAQLARAMRDHFIVEGRYTYSLDFSRIRRDPTLDPIEDFVANHRTGHCEYFASALAMMLRSQGIPARLVIGFHCDEYNAVGGYYQVRQLHAHAWVEAYLEPEDVAAELPPNSDVGVYGGWLRLDATPGFDVDRTLQTDQGVLGMVDDVLDFARVVWSDYVLGLTAARQKETIYETVSEQADPDAWSDFWRRLLQRRRQAEQFLRVLITDVRFLLLVLLVLLLFGARWFREYTRRPDATPVVRRVTRWTARLAGRTDGDTSSEPAGIEFYERLERLLADLGLLRSWNQTPREFADQADARLAEVMSGEGDFVDRVVAAYYRVRFGGHQLEPAEMVGVDACLTAIENHAKQRVAASHPGEDAEPVSGER
jgi:hypothetical protein